MTSSKPSGSILAPNAVPSKNTIPPFAALRAFDAVARLGGMRKAALNLSIDHTVVSRHLRTLEEWIGVALIERSQGAITLTPEGHRYHLAIAAAIDGIASATLGLLKERDSSQLEVWCMPGLAFQWLLPRLGELEAANPGLMIDIRPTDHSPDLLKYEADIDIRYLPIYDPVADLPSSVRSIKLAEFDVIPVASPDYLACHPMINEARDLLDHQLLYDRRFLNWHTWLSSHGVENLLQVNGPRLWQAHLSIDAAKRGRGVTLVNKLLAEEALGAGHLVEIGDGTFAPVSLGAYYFYARADRWTAKPIATFRNWLAKAISRATRK